MPSAPSLALDFLLALPNQATPTIAFGALLRHGAEVAKFAVALITQQSFFPLAIDRTWQNLIALRDRLICSKPISRARKCWPKRCRRLEFDRSQSNVPFRPLVESRRRKSSHQPRFSHRKKKNAQVYKFLCLGTLEKRRARMIENKKSWRRRWWERWKNGSQNDRLTRCRRCLR